MAVGGGWSDGLQGVGLGAGSGRLLEEAHVASSVPALGHHLLLDQRERHGDQHQSEQQVTAARDQLELTVLRVRALERLARYQVTEPDGGQRDEAKVRTVDERPALPGGEHGRTQTYVADQHEQHQGHRYARRRRVPLLGRPLVGRGRSGRSRGGRLPVVLVRCGRLSPAVFVGAPLLLAITSAYQRHSARRAVRSVVHLAENGEKKEVKNI